MANKQNAKKRQMSPKKKKLSLSESLSTLRRVLKYLRNYRALFLLSLLMSAAVVFFTLYIPIVLGEAIDLIVEGNVNFEGMMPLLLR
ncbi:MAG: ABC transporter ATP-binding protein, partial [Clostridia bacterium]|nr:ABC transporter ATP-binding protein [Clostridia bacterium]